MNEFFESEMQKHQKYSKKKKKKMVESVACTCFVNIHMGKTLFYHDMSLHSSWNLDSATVDHNCASISYAGHHRRYEKQTPRNWVSHRKTDAKKLNKTQKNRRQETE